MAPSKFRKAIGAVKDRTSISIAKVTTSTIFTDLDVAILKATRHEECPSSERYIREILTLTLWSKTHVTSCIESLSRRLNKTKSWTVALKTLMLIQRLLTEGDPSYEKELYHTTRRGARFLNMSDFRDTKRSGSWDYSAYVRTYSLYLDEQLEFRMYNRRLRTRLLGSESDKEDTPKTKSPIPLTPVREFQTEDIFVRTHHLNQLLERFLACRPTGPAKNNRVVLASLYPLVKESFQIYYDIVEILNILIERFMGLEVRDCTKVQEIFIRTSKQFEDLDGFYSWCRTMGVARSSEYPEVDRIEQKKIELMDEFIKDKIILSQGKRVKNYLELKKEVSDVKEKVLKTAEEDTQASPPPPKEIHEVKKEEKNEEIKQEKNEEIKQEKKEDFKEAMSEAVKQETKEEKNSKQEMDLLDLGETQVENHQQQDKWALALTDVGATTKTESTSQEWIAFPSEEPTNWESALVQSASAINEQNSNGGGIDKNTLDRLYQESPRATAQPQGWGSSGSASSVVGQNWNQQEVLALPAPPVSGSSHGNAMWSSDPFSASLQVAPPTFVQMSEMGTRHKSLVDEKVMWQQYAIGGMQGPLGMQQFSHGTGVYNHIY